MGSVLVVTNDFPPRVGGIESFVFSLCSGFSSDQLVVYTATMSDSVKTDASLPYPVIRDTRRILLPTPRVSRAVRRVARDYGCDRVVFGAAAPLGLLARDLRSTGVRRIVGLTHGHEVWWSKTPGARTMLRRIGEDIDVLTYVSDYCGREIAKALSPAAGNKMVRLSPGVDTAVFRPAADKALLRRELGLEPARQVVLAVSRLVARKGHDVLIAAWPAILARCPGAVLLIVGDGAQRARLQWLARRARITESVRFLPALPWSQLPPVYAAADVFALPCRTRLRGLEPEAFGIVFLEAAAAGLPIVVGASGGAPETVSEGETGYVVDPRDVVEVAARVVDLLAAPAVAAGMGRRGRERVQCMWSTRRGVQTLHGLLEEIR
ncbi:MAG: glycosyltransferase family 4 protein [Nocardioidaceae bacterium]